METDVTQSQLTTLSRKALLTDRALRALKLPPPGKRFVLWDMAVPSLCVRVTSTGCASFSILRRIKGCPAPVRHTIGVSWKTPFPAGHPLPYSLAQARADARDAIISMARGIDPRLRKAPVPDALFKDVAETFIEKHVSTLRSGKETAAAIRREIIPVFENNTIVNITRQDITSLLARTQDRPHTARHLLAHLSKLFAWQMARDASIPASPCAGIRISEIVGKAIPRDRVLSGAELRDVWMAADRLGYPGGALIKMLILTGQRLREAAESQWCEFDIEHRLWLIPAARMKGGTAHEVPLPEAVAALLNNMPRWKESSFVFSLDGGRPISSFSWLKKQLDALLPGMPPWRFHDLRRTMRTGLGGLPVPNNVAELCIAHAQPGLHKVYDRHAYRAEKLHAFELWAARVAEVVS